MIRGIGPRTANLLLDRFGSPANVFAASRELLRSEGLKPDTIDQLQHTEILDKAQAEIERLETLGAKVLTLDDDAYPPLLREIYDPPMVLYVKGALTAKDKNAVAMVGSRQTTHYGIETARKLAKAAPAITAVAPRKSDKAQPPVSQLEKLLT